MRRILMVVALLAILLVGVAACSSGEDAAFDEPLSAAFDGGNAGITAAQPVDQTQPIAQSGPITTDRIILRDASLSLIVDDPAAEVLRINALAVDSGGWVVSATTRASGVARASIQIRVPAAQFDAVLAAIKTDVLEVTSEVITGQDVTQEYTDLTSQLRNLEAAEAQLQSFLEDAEDTEAVLSVYDELVTIRGQIETTRGRINFFDQAAAFALIAVELDAETPPVESDSDDDWDPGDTLDDALGSLGAALRLIIDVVIYVVIVGVPLLLFVGIPGWFLRRLLIRTGVGQSNHTQRGTYGPSHTDDVDKPAE